MQALPNFNAAFPSQPAVQHQTGLESAFLRQELSAMERGIQPVQDFFHNATGLAGAAGATSFLSQTGIKLLITHGILKKPFHRKDLALDLALDLAIGAMLGGGIGTLLEELRLKDAAKKARQQFDVLKAQVSERVTALNQSL